VSAAVPASARYLAASVPTRLATAGSAVALPVLAVQQVGDIAVGGLLVAAGLAPAVIVAPFVGVLLDRSPRPGRLIAAAALLSSLALVAAAFLGALPTAVVVVALAAAGALTPFTMGGLSSIVADTIPDERRAYAHDALSYNIAGVAGPGVVAALLTVVPAQPALFLLAAITLAGGAAAATLAVAPKASSDTRDGVLRRIAAGVRYLVAHRPLAVVTASATLSQVGAGALPIAAVGLALARTGSSESGAWIVTAFAIGALIGSLASAVFARLAVPPHQVMLAGYLVTGLATLPVVPDWGIGVSLATVVVSGFGSAPATAAMLLLRKQHSPASVRSQVFTVGAGLRSTAAAAGVGIAGVIAVAPETLFLMIGACWVTSALTLLAFPRNVARFDTVD